MKLNPSMKVEDLARKQGEIIAGQLKGLKYYRFDTSDNSFVQYIDFMEGAKGVPEIVERRKRFDQETTYVDAVAKFIAIITAPSEIERTDVIDSWFDDIRIDRDNIGKFNNIETDGYGYDIKASLDKKKRDYDNFVKFVDIVCGEIEKILPKIELPKIDTVLWTQD